MVTERIRHGTKSELQESPKASGELEKQLEGGKNSRMRDEANQMTAHAPELDRKNDTRIIVITVSLSAIYATVRYNVLRGDPWSDWPHYIGNKILALSGLVLIAVAIVRLGHAHGRSIRRLMAAGSGLALAHTFVSLPLLEPIYYGKFFVGEKLSVTAGISLVTGSFAMALLVWGNGRKGSSAPAGAAAALGVVTFLTALHAGLASTSSWVTPASWPGYLPPITLWSFCIALLATVAAARVYFRSVGRN